MEVVSKQIRLVGVDEVKPDPRNARQHPERNLETIKTSLRVYGQRKPIVVNKRTGMIEAGHGLWQAAKALGWEKIAVVYVDDDPATATGYAIMDNRTAELADWDYPILSELLRGLDGVMDFEAVGFKDFEVGPLLEGEFSPPSIEDLGEEKEKKTKTVTCPECGAEFEI